MYLYFIQSAVNRNKKQNQYLVRPPFAFGTAQVPSLLENLSQFLCLSSRHSVHTSETILGPVLVWKLIATEVPVLLLRNTCRHVAFACLDGTKRPVILFGITGREVWHNSVGITFYALWRTLPNNNEYFIFWTWALVDVLSVSYGKWENHKLTKALFSSKESFSEF